MDYLSINSDLILLKLVSFCSEWFALYKADKFSSKSMTSGDIF